jgi:hypothetical protein
MECVEPIRNKEKIELVKRILKEHGSRDFLLFLMGINIGLRISDILIYLPLPLRVNYPPLSSLIRAEDVKLVVQNQLKNAQLIVRL